MGYIGTRPADAPLTSEDIADGVVTAPKLATDAVETVKVKDLNVTVAKLPAAVDISTKTVTLPATVGGLGTGIDAATQLANKVPAANLGTGTASASTYLAGDQSYKEIVAIDIAWQSVVTAATLTAVAGRGYPINTTSNTCTVTLPAAASVGDQIIFTDYARNWNTNALTINQNSLNFQGNTTPNPEYDTDGESVNIVYMDATKGWVPINDGAVAWETNPEYSVEYLVVAGGGGGGKAKAAGGGAGGLLTSTFLLEPSIVYTVTVGSGGPGSTSGVADGSQGINSVVSGTGLSTVTAIAGGGGGSDAENTSTLDGGSGGGAAGGGNETQFGTGTVGQGNNGGQGVTGAQAGGGGGGGASAVGVDAVGTVGGNGGNGTASSITGASETYAGGGGGAHETAASTQGSGGAGGGGAGVRTSNGTAGLANTGGGGGGTHSGTAGGAGGLGVVILRMPTARYSGTITGSPTVDQSTVSGQTILIFNASGSYTG